MNRFVNTALLILTITFLAACSGTEGRIATHFNRGVSLYEEGNLTKALLEFKNVLQIDGSHIDARLYVAKINEQTQKWPQAASNYLRILESEPTHIEARVRLGQLYLLGGEFTEAKTQLDEAMRHAPMNPAVLTLEGSLYASQGDLEKAMQSGQLALKEDAKYANAAALVGSLYIRQSKFQKAAEVLERGIQSNPEHSGLQTMLARVLAAEADYVSAESIFRRVVTREPSNLAYRVQLAAFLASLDRLEEAEAVFFEGVEIDRTNNTLLTFIGFLVEHAKRDRAVEILLEYISQRENNVDLRIGLAGLYESAGQTTLAQTQYQKIIDAEKHSPDGLAALTRIGDLKRRDGDFEGAIKVAEEVLEQNRHDKRALLLRASASLALSKGNTAIADLQTVLRDFPNDSETLRLLAQAYVATDAIADAHEAFQRAVKVNARDPRNHWAYADFLLRLGDVKNAAGHLESVVRLQPDNQAALEQLVRVQLAGNDVDAALENAKRFREVAPDDPKGYLLQGLAYHSKGQYEDAISVLTFADLSDPHGAQALSVLLKCYLALGDTTSAHDRLDAIVATQPAHTVARNLRGELLLMQDNLTDAAAEFRAVIELRPDWGVPYRNLGTVLVRQGNTNRAVEVFQEGLKATNGAPALVFELATRYEQLGNTQLAIEQYEALLARNPNLHAAANNLALLLVTYNQNDADSIARARALTERFQYSSNTAYLDTLGWVQFKSGDLDAAKETLEKVVRAAPGVPVYQYHLGMVYHKRGEFQRARQLLTKAIETDQDFRGKTHAQTTLDSILSG